MTDPGDSLKPDTPMPDPVTGEGIVTQRVIQLPGQESGFGGFAGADRPGPTIKIVAIPAWRYILEGIILYDYVNAWVGVAALDGAGQLAKLIQPGDVLTHLWYISGCALFPTAVAFAQQLLKYLQKRRAAMGIE